MSNIQPTMSKSVANEAPTDKTHPPEHASESEIPFTTKCNECQTTVITTVKHKPGPFTWIACIMVSSFGFFLGCCFIPFCVKSAKDIVHTCPTCQAEIGRHSRF